MTEQKDEKEIMLQNLLKLIPKLENRNHWHNKFDKFAVLLDDYINSHNFDFGLLKFSMNNMFETLHSLLATKKNDEFIKLLNIYLRNNFDINFQDRITDERFRTAYELCIQRGSYNMGSLILTASLGINLSNAIEKYCSDNDEINSISKLFLFYLKKNCNMNNTFDTIMNVLENTLIDLINNKKCFSKYLLKVVFDYNITKNTKRNNYYLKVKTNKLWIAIRNKLSQVLNINTLYKEKVDWYWFKNYLLNTNIWLLKIDENDTLLYSQLLNMVKSELKKQENQLKNDMKLLIYKNNNTKEIWNKICNFEYKNNKYKLYRQDIILNGISSSYDSNELNKIYINSNGKFNIFSLNDYNNYLSSLIILGHKLNTYFISSVKEVLYEYISKEKCVFKDGPVKTIDRCVIKSQLDYNDNKYPTSSCIIDIIRGSVTFKDLGDYYNSIMHFIQTIQDENSEISHNISDILRIKNGFNSKYKKYLKESKKENLEEKKINIENENDCFIPNSYLDIKINVIITHNNESIIGELQFLLQPMLNNKKENHELYEINRLKDIILHSNNNLKNTNVNKQFEIAIASKNKNEIAKVIVLNNLKDIKINRLGKDSSETPLFLQTIKTEWSYDLIFKYFIDEIHYKTSDKNKKNVLHYFAIYFDKENQVQKSIVELVVTKILEKDPNLINSQNKNGLTPFMECLRDKNTFILSTILNIISKQSNAFLINFSLLDQIDKSNLFHYLFKYNKFNSYDMFNPIMNRYEAFKKKYNIPNYNLLFKKNYLNKTIFHYGLGGYIAFSVEILKKLESYLNNDKKLYNFIFEDKDNDENNTPFMYLIRGNYLDIAIIEYILNKFKNEITQSNYKALVNIRNYENKNVISFVKRLPKRNKCKVLFESLFTQLF